MASSPPPDGSLPPPPHPLPNLVFGISIFVFNAFTNFSGQYMYSDVYMTLFNVIFTAVRLGFIGQYMYSDVYITLFDVIFTAVRFAQLCPALS